jgi:hypothetical protein
LKRLRIVSIALAAVIAMPVNVIAAPANAAVTFVNTVPVIDPNLSALVNGGVIGDKIRFTQTGVTSAVVTFAGTSNNTATASRVGSTDTWEFTVPSGAKTGAATVSINGGAGTSAGTFQVWKSRGEPYVMPAGHINVTYNDLQFILDQIKMAEAHSLRTATSLSGLSVNTPKSSIIYPYDVTSATRCLVADDITSAATTTFGSTGLSGSYVWTAEDPLGLRTVDGQCNNISRVMAETNPAVPANTADTAAWGAAEQNFNRLEKRSTGSSNADRAKYDVPSANVSDATPRTISNLISDQSVGNPAAIAAATESADVLYGAAGFVTENSVNATNGSVTTVLDIPNITADYNVSAGYDSWFTLFGQFFDHGLDLIPKAGASVLIPLLKDDPLYVQGSNTNFMVLTRAADATTGESINLTTPWIDQSQTYGSHPSQNVFVREYNFGTSASTRAVATGRLLDESSAGGMPTWKVIKAQAKKLGILLTDYDVNSVPVIATNQYGKFIPGANGYPVILFTNSLRNSFVWKEGTAAGLETSISISGAPWTAVSTGHPFLNDTTAAAVPYGIGQSCSGKKLTADSDSIMNSAAASPNCNTYDDETLDAHLIAGDGRINENIGLSAVHNVFHGEHNLLVRDIEDLLTKNPVVPAAFAAEWTGERKYQAARFIMEMEYQHMVYDEFARRIAPELPVFLTYDPSINAQITAEFASAVYRLGHSMLNETIARSNPGQFYDPSNNQDVSLITAFTNPAQARLERPAVIERATSNGSSTTYTLQANEKAPLAGSIVTISNMADSNYNVKDAVVDSRTTTGQHTFTISTQYRGAASAQSISGVPGAGSSLSKKTTDLVNIAAVTISDPGSNPYSYTALESTAAIAQGMSEQRGNEIDEFVTDGVRNNLLGLPLDLAALNITRGRDVGLPSLNNFRASTPNSKLQPYASWYSFIINGLRHRESGVNFVAAYGTDPTLAINPASLTPTADKRAAAMLIVSAAIPVFITNAVYGTNKITYTSFNSYSVGQHVTVSGITGTTGTCNVTGAEITAADATSFEVSATGANCAGYVAMHAGGSGSGGTALYAPITDAEKAQAKSAIDFINGPAATTGLNEVDLWIGGLAENPDKQPLIPPMLGPTFQYVFTDQMQKLQDNDRFYYLSRLLGTNLFGEIPAQKLTDIVRRNTPSPSRGIIGMNSPGFSVADCTSGSQAGLVPDSISCKSLSTSNAPFDLTNTDLLNMVLFGDPTTTNPVRLSGGGGDDSIQGGRGDDLLSGGVSGGDIVLGFEGNDIIFGGPGEDILNGGSGNDVIDAGNSQAGDIADGGTGSDYIHCGMCSGLAVSFHGESGNDFVQGGLASDLALIGGEGDDWLEGGPGLDILSGDNGIFGNILLGLPSYYGGNDVINPGPGLDTPFGDGGDDIFLLGQGSAVTDGAYGFDWANFEYNIRFDNGATTRPSVWADLGGNINPGTARSGDQLVFIEGLSGSSGNDQLFGGTGRNNQVITGATGFKNTTQLTLPGTLTILPGSHVSGTGIAPNAIVTDFPAIKNGTTTTLRLSAANTGLVFNATVTISTEQLRTPSLISGLSELVTNTPIWTTNNGGWSGGAILLGGEGNDSLYPSDGADVIHGSAYLHTCILLSSTNAAALAATDVKCADGRGFSNMSLVSQFMDSGAVAPTDLRIVREILPTATRVTAIASTGSAITYTADNNFYVGERISVSGLVSGTTNLNAYQPRNAVITAVTSTTFTVTSTAPVLTSPITGITAGTAVATDTLDLSGGLTADPGAVPNAVGGISGPESQFTFTRITSPLPSGATYGCTVTDSVSGNKMYVYDVEMVLFSGGTAKAISTNCGGFDVPSAPAAPVAVAGQTKATITWVAPATNGAAIDYYAVDYYKRGLFNIWPNTPTAYSAGTCSGTANNKQVAGNLLTCTVEGLTAGNVVRFEVRAHNAAGFSAASPNSNEVTVLAANAKLNPVLAWSNLSVTPGLAWTLTPPTITSGPQRGTFTYAVTPASTTVTLIGAAATASMTPGTATIVATYTPAVADQGLYNTATATMTVTVSSTPVVVTPGPTGPFTITTTPLASINGNFTAITSVTLGTTGGAAGTVTYSVTPANLCRISGGVLTASGAGTCTVTARKATTPTATTATLAVVFILADQAALRITNTSLSTAHTNSFQVTTSGGSGSGAVSYAATLGANSACSISTTGVLTSGVAGSTCSVTVTKAASSLYNATTSTALVFRFT